MSRPGATRHDDPFRAQFALPQTHLDLLTTQKVTLTGPSMTCAGPSMTYFHQ